MKSLEIINKLSKATWYDQETDTLITYISKDMLNQIRQALEVLEIIREKMLILVDLKQNFIFYLTHIN